MFDLLLYAPVRRSGDGLGASVIVGSCSGWFRRACPPAFLVWEDIGLSLGSVLFGLSRGWAFSHGGKGGSSPLLAVSSLRGPPRGVVALLAIDVVDKFFPGPAVLLGARLLDF